MQLGIKAKDIMKQDFPILDSSFDLETCMKKMNKQEACVILNNGFLYSVLSYNDVLREFLMGKINIKLKEIKSEQNFVVVEPYVDVIDIINLMTKEEVDFVIVKPQNSSQRIHNSERILKSEHREDFLGDENFIGLITKREIAEINQVLFDILSSKNIGR